ncbi:MAG: response regulator transcription factor [Saprospiraceae bacterium]|nr:response regulator transcription factor [Saprospiraceae bacterium]
MSIRILIVEDEPVISEDLAMILRREGHVITGQAYDGMTALDMIYHQKPQLILLDIALDHSMSGLDVAKIINEKYQIPFIFITSFSDSYTLDLAKNLLPQAYIVKPFKKKDIVATIEITAFRISRQTASGYLNLEEINESLVEKLTSKEYELLIDLSSGLHNEEIAQKHFISINTVKTHLKKSYAKLEVNSRSQATVKLRR